MITAIDVAWAAGFLEGEGTFVSNGNGVSVKAPQVQREPLDRLQKLFGGKVRKGINRGLPIHHWDLHGTPAAAVTMTIFSLLSPRRKDQALNLINKWKSAPGVGSWNAKKTHCPKGHEYIGDNIKRSRKRDNWRVCRSCANERSRLHYSKSKLVAA